mmetsp:Transcript_17158/g.40191  ORF Transcript_17158/g.40191 Transcript_17158/m.40191 type:complete len:200 (+) Transcript_17158:403-1002(+)
METWTAHSTSRFHCTLVGSRASSLQVTATRVERCTVCLELPVQSEPPPIVSTTPAVGSALSSSSQLSVSAPKTPLLKSGVSGSSVERTSLAQGPSRHGDARLPHSVISYRSFTRWNENGSSVVGVNGERLKPTPALSKVCEQSSLSSARAPANTAQATASASDARRVEEGEEKRAATRPLPRISAVDATILPVKALPTF